MTIVEFEYIKNRQNPVVSKFKFTKTSLYLIFIHSHKNYSQKICLSKLQIN